MGGGQGMVLQDITFILRPEGEKGANNWEMNVTVRENRRPSGRTQWSERDAHKQMGEICGSLMMLTCMCTLMHYVILSVVESHRRV